MKTAFTHITLGLQLAAVMLLLVYIGYRLDIYFDKTPLFMALGAALGMSAGMYNLMKELGKMEARNREEKDERSDRGKTEELTLDKEGEPPDSEKNKSRNG